MDDIPEKHPNLDGGETDLGSDSPSEPAGPDDAPAEEKKQTEDFLEPLKEVDEKLRHLDPQKITASFPPNHPDLPEVNKLLTSIDDKITSLKKQLQPKGNAKASKVKVFCVVAGKTFGAEAQILQRIKAEESKDPGHCDVVMVFCSICSRASVDVAEALRKIPGEAGGRAVILVMMHHTINKQFSVSSTDWTRDNVKLSVSVLYHETESGLLECSRNNDVIKEIQQEATKHCKASLMTKGITFLKEICGFKKNTSPNE